MVSGNQDRGIGDRDRGVGLQRPVAVMGGDLALIDQIGTASTETSEVFLNWMIDWFISAGIMRLIACGSTMRRMLWPGVMPSAAPASDWPCRSR